MDTCSYESWSMKDLAEVLSTHELGNKIIVVPVFQRGKRWKEPQEKSFINSLKKGHPIGTLLFFKTVEGSKETYVLVDGLQRGNTIKKYIQSPNAYFDFADVPQELIDELYNALEVFGGSEKGTKESIGGTIVEFVRSINSSKKIQYYDYATKLMKIIASPVSKELLLNRIMKIVEPFFEQYQKDCDDLSSTSIPIIAYKGEESELPEIFEKMNRGGTPLSTYDVYAASWPQDAKFQVNNRAVIEWVLKKYDALGDDGYTWRGFDRDKVRKGREITPFQYVFGFSKFLNNDVNILHFKHNAKDDEIDPLGFELINACLNNTSKGIEKLYVQIGNIQVNKFEKCLMEALRFVEQSIRPITVFKGNSRNNNKILHSKYQILSMISSTFREMYDVSDLDNKKQSWRKIEGTLGRNLAQHYVYDIISDEWKEGVQSNFYETSKKNKYLLPIKKNDWSRTLNNWFEDSLKISEIDKVKTPSNKDIIFLNCIYLPLFSAKQQLNTDAFDIEHLATKELMKNAIKDSGGSGLPKGSGLPISSIGNLCYLPQYINRSKKANTFYQDKEYLEKIELKEVEDKYSFTKADDLDWLDKSYSDGEYDKLRLIYLNFLKNRFIIQTQMFVKSMDIK